MLVGVPLFKKRQVETNKGVSDLKTFMDYFCCFYQDYSTLLDFKSFYDVIVLAGQLQVQIGKEF